MKFQLKNQILFDYEQNRVKKYTYSAKRTDIKDQWYISDEKGAVLGRLATKIATRLRGKPNPLYTPHKSTGSFA